MKIAVTSDGETPDSAVDRRFGRAAVFQLFDTETGEYTVHPNTQNLNAAQGAGIQAAQTVVGLGAEVVITGHCGPKAFRVLQASEVGIVLNAEGSVKELVEKFQAGELTFAESADVEGHWV